MENKSYICHVKRYVLDSGLSYYAFTDTTYFKCDMFLSHWEHN